MTLPFLDLGAAHAELQVELEAVAAEVMRRGWYVLGPEVEAFESEFAAFVEAAHCVGVGNGLDALHLALRAVGVGPGDEVIVPSNTYIATWLGVSMCGAVPVPVEPIDATCNLDPERIAAAVTPRTRAIMPVHLYGQPADMTAICEVARAHGLAVVDDAAQAHGARWDGRAIGTLADATSWSFYPTKNLGAVGDGGAVTTNSPEVAARIRGLRNYGTTKKYISDERGVNSRLDELQAALLRVKLRVLPEWNQRRVARAQRYLDGLQGSALRLPETAAGAAPVWHLFVVRSDDRDGLAVRLAAAGVATIIHYPVPPHLQPAYAELGLEAGAFPISERMHGEVLSLPIGPHMSDAHQQLVIDAV